MLVKIISVTFNSAYGGFDDTELRNFIKDIEVISITDHLFVRNEIPYLTLIVKYFPLRQVVSKANQLNTRGASPAENIADDAEYSEAQESPPAEASPVEDLGEFVCQVGKKFKGQKLKDIPMEGLSSFVSWIREQEDASPTLLTFAEKAEAFIANGTDVDHE